MDPRGSRGDYLFSGMCLTMGEWGGGGVIGLAKTRNLGGKRKDQGGHPFYGQAKFREEEKKCSKYERKVRREE